LRLNTELESLQNSKVILSPFVSADKNQLRKDLGPTIFHEYKEQMMQKFSGTVSDDADVEGN
jgi:hypothetical protein